MPRSYDPSKNYGASGSSNKFGALGASPALPRQVIGSPNFWKIAAILDGNDDERYKHTVTSADLTPNANFTITFAHGLSFEPNVSASVYVQTDDKSRPLPWHYYGTGSYSAVPPSAVIQVDSVDDSDITVRVTIHDLGGLSFISANTELIFKFVCFQEGIV